MDTGVRLTLPKAGAFGENIISKNEGSLGEKPNFGPKVGGIGWECYFWSFSEHFKSRNLKKKIIENGKNDQFVDEIETKSSFLWQPNAKKKKKKKLGDLWVRAIEEPTFHQKMWVFGWQQRQSLWGHWVTTAVKIWGLWSLTSASPP